MDARAAEELLARIELDARLLAQRFGLRYRAIEAERANVRRRYGVCFRDGTIRIRLRHAVSGRPLKYSSLVNTLCHELAHLRHFNHGLRFRAFYERILEYARDRGIYRPAGRSPADLVPPAFAEPAPGRGRALERSRADSPEQLALFG